MAAGSGEAPFAEGDAGPTAALPGPPEVPKTSDRPDDPSQVSSPPILPESRQGSLLWRVRGVIRTMRPQQWVKNAFVLAPIVFAKHLTHPSIIKRGLGAFGIFCLLAGAVYTMNDIVDVEADRAHPVKRHRPIASGRVPIPMAKALAVALVLISLVGSIPGGPWFAAVVVAYFVQNVLYSFKLKKVAYVDVCLIAAGFVLRVLAGGFAINTMPSWYMVGCTALLALFLGFGKRRHELATAANAKKQRSALSAYSPHVLNVALAITGFATVGLYLAYTIDSHTRAFFKNDYLWLTVAHPLFGIVRFLQLVAGRPRAESPTQEMLRDTPFVVNLILWVIEVVVILYQIRPSG
ncbi:MAG: decaprenyl-phosphate phosphoribosyltransferase [Polyangiaceae bacterium]|nr:decaprenyl-phosphate phosphoribosyltransferase [Polyangiaceae bacterium]